jgi:hypothetical protein
MASVHVTVGDAQHARLGSPDEFGLLESRTPRIVALDDREEFRRKRLGVPAHFDEVRVSADREVTGIGDLPDGGFLSKPGPKGKGILDDFGSYRVPHIGLLANFIGEYDISPEGFTRPRSSGQNTEYMMFPVLSIRTFG